MVIGVKVAIKPFFASSKSCLSAKGKSFSTAAFICLVISLASLGSTAPSAVKDVRARAMVNTDN
ncbi:hypothetical protein D9M71_827170 [compost metagenome]